MIVQQKHFRTIWFKNNCSDIVCIIDQRTLPHQFIIEEITTIDEMIVAIKEMHLRGAGLIGVAAGYGMYLAILEAEKEKSFDISLQSSAKKLIDSRPTAVNLIWAVNRQMQAISEVSTVGEKKIVARNMALTIADEDAAFCKNIGEHGVKIIEAISHKKQGDTVNILTHCNAGWLAFVDYGSATAPIYEAFKRGVKIHIWVDETRPRNQGASLTAWELLNAGVPHTIIADNTGGHLMQHGMVDMVIVGADRVTRAGDAANKIGTYLKALAAKDNGIPFYVALPSSTFDWKITDGVKEIPIEERDAEEVKYITGLCDNELKKVLVTPLNSNASNFGFDVTPARLIRGFITERGICEASEKSIASLYPEKVIR
ncbi:MAG: S-methyl-5-thioribose-1-phosphate isomerase [Bacteroidales bacterium]|nr:S-methyl-5-thioribose-1-phosphate isomerase [Bacteroidales bacterium]